MTTRGTTDGGQRNGDQVDGGDQPSRTTKAVILALLAVFLIGGVAAVVVAVGLIGGDGTAKTDDATPIDVDKGGEKNGGGAASTTEPSKADQTTTTDPAANNGVGENPVNKTLDGASTTPVSVPFPAQTTALLQTVRVAGHGDFDRVVFQFDGPVPGYTVQYVPGPLTEDPTGRSVDIKGDRFLVVTMNPASGVSMDGPTYKEVYTGPDRIAGPGTPVAEVVRTGDFEAVLTWSIGVASNDGERPFKVTKLESPSRLVIDVAR